MSMNDGLVNLWAQRLAAVAGLLDLGAGLGIVFLPVLTLRLMLVAVPGAEALVYVRFVGVFVAAIGASYLYALGRGGGALRGVFGFTVPFRLGAGAFCAVMVTRGELAPMWLIVTLADLGLVVAQVWFLRQNWGRRA